MGLDQYLYRRIYVQNWDHMPESQKWQIAITKGGETMPLAFINPAKITYIEEEVGYWRKANQIHKWFVDNCQDGVDDCRRAWVPREKLEELKRTVETVLASITMKPAQIYAGTQFSGGRETTLYEDGETVENASVAEALLPAQEGFFFGGTDYDQWYVTDLKHTLEILEYALSLDPAAGEFEYHSSW